MEIITYNIHHGVGMDGQLDISRIADILLKEAGCIIGLQEVDRHYGMRSAYQDQVQALASMLNFHYTFGANIDLPHDDPGKPNRQYGNALFSKYPIIESENRPLSSFGKEQRGILMATLEIEGVHVHIFNTHLSLEKTVKMTQIREIIEYAESFNGRKILMGDFNALPDSEEIRLLLRESDFVDSGICSSLNTFPANQPEHTIDYIFSDGLTTVGQRVVKTIASDHLPVVKKMELAKKME